MEKYPNTERRNWRDITPADATSAELNLVHMIMGERPKHITPEQWRDNMRGCAVHIRKHVSGEISPTPATNNAISEIATIAGRLSLYGHEDDGGKILAAVEVLALHIEGITKADLAEAREGQREAEFYGRHG